MSATIKQLRAFVTVARSRSLAQASAQLHISQPALSIAIRNLEDATGGQLFSREARQLTLTPEGGDFLSRAEQLLHSWDQSLDAVQQAFRLERGQLRLAVIPAFALNRLPALLADFHRRYPHINILLEDVVMEQVTQSVQEGRAELGISFHPDDLGGLEFIPFNRDRFIAVVPPQHPLASKPKVRWCDLANFPFIAMNRGSAVRRWTDDAFQQSCKAVHYACEANQLSTIGQLVRAGLGISAVPSLCEAQVREYKLKCRPLSAPVVSQEVGVLLKSRDTLSTPANAFLSAITG
ncbi:LysR substrate-binding domain-containing protein [Microbulbifer sp. OS29]|uniref:LysR substrate-binding domain-containing protein n=1 Tax=Microbulbifer okhotskensis TaxID=2926617 RepID=A0A9X2EQK0_9GAMM|nr:LysR family transcriptional regulator [Microbulbifer okhotskensis]MCO1335510.1 LysR substrate-binding domain-containing protein [Microbulbifer okhotskensis]